MAAADPTIADSVDQKSVAKYASVVATAIHAVNTFTEKATSVEVNAPYFCFHLCFAKCGLHSSGETYIAMTIHVHKQCAHKCARLQLFTRILSNVTSRGVCNSLYATTICLTEYHFAIIPSPHRTRIRCTDTSSLCHTDCTEGCHCGSR